MSIVQGFNKKIKCSEISNNRINCRTVEDFWWRGWVVWTNYNNKNREWLSWMVLKHIKVDEQERSLYKRVWEWKWKIKGTVGRVQEIKLILVKDLATVAINQIIKIGKVVVRKNWRKR